MDESQSSHICSCFIGHFTPKRQEHFLYSEKAPDTVCGIGGPSLDYRLYHLISLASRCNSKLPVSVYTTVS